MLGVGWELDPDLDLELIDAATGNPVIPSNNDIPSAIVPWPASSAASAGRRPSITCRRYMPPGPGSYQFRVYAFAGGGDFALEVSGRNGGLKAVASAPAKA